MLQVDIKKEVGGFLLEKKLHVACGEVTTLFGPSGSGKSLTVKCIAGLITPERGSISLNNRSLFSSQKKINLPPRERRVGYVPQQYGLFPHLTVINNIMFAIQAKSKQEKMHRAKGMLAEVGLHDQADKYPGELSGGERQRVALLRAMAMDPEVLLLDEPFSAVDSKLREQLRENVTVFLKKLQIPVVLITHDVRDIAALQTEVVHY
jgi:ABC-type sulfate/molybdate transport systems ATPase subunit